jgi:hypothetical protein
MVTGHSSQWPGSVAASCPNSGPLRPHWVERTQRSSIVLRPNSTTAAVTGTFGDSDPVIFRALSTCRISPTSILS